MTGVFGSHFFAARDRLPGQDASELPGTQIPPRIDRRIDGPCP